MALFNQLGYAAGAVGNHEFDWGQDTLRARMREARYALLGANVRYADGRDVPWIRDDTLITRGALKVGVDRRRDTAHARRRRAPSNVADLRFVEPAPIVDSLARRLRARGADSWSSSPTPAPSATATAPTSCNGEIVDLARQLREPVDAIVSGHTHSLVDAVVNGIPIVQARSSGTALGVIDLGPERQSPPRRDVLADSLAADPRSPRIVARGRGARGAGRRTSPSPRSPTTLMRDGHAVSARQPHRRRDARRREGRRRRDEQRRHPREPARGRRPPTATLFEVQPFGNALYRVTVTGAALRAYLERLVARRAQRPRQRRASCTLHDVRRASPARAAARCERQLVLNDSSPTAATGSRADGAIRRALVLNDSRTARQPCGDGLRIVTGRSDAVRYSSTAASTPPSDGARRRR